MPKRCAWVPADNPLYIRYHDYHWGVPVYQDNKLFEYLVLESFQAGLSWLTILKKRPNFHRSFANFNPRRVARFNTSDQTKLMQDPGIVRNLKKIQATITNAQAFLEIQQEFGSFNNFLWEFVAGQPKVNQWQYPESIPVMTPESQAISQTLKKRGFKFFGPTTAYSFMQAIGMVNDHTTNCFRYQQIIDSY